MQSLTERWTATARCRRSWRQIRRVGFAGARRDARRPRDFPWHRAPRRRDLMRASTRQGLRLACAEPGDQLAIFGEALRELTVARDLSLRGGRPLLVFNAADAQPRRRRSREGAAGPRGRCAPSSRSCAMMLATRAAFIAYSPAPDDPISIDEAERSFARDPWASDAAFRQGHCEIGCDRRSHRHADALSCVAAALP